MDKCDSSMCYQYTSTFERRPRSQECRVANNLTDDTRRRGWWSMAASRFNRATVLTRVAYMPRDGKLFSENYYVMRDSSSSSICDINAYSQSARVYVNNDPEVVARRASELYKSENRYFFLYIYSAFGSIYNSAV